MLETVMEAVKGAFQWINDMVDSILGFPIVKWLLDLSSIIGGYLLWKDDHSWAGYVIVFVAAALEKHNIVGLAEAICGLLFLNAAVFGGSANIAFWILLAVNFNVLSGLVGLSNAIKGND